MVFKLLAPFSLPFILLSLLSLLSPLSPTRNHPLCHDHERSALLQFKRSFYGASPSYTLLDSWNRSDCCDWDGVGCDDVTGYVFSLNLTYSWLVGSIDSRSSVFQLLRLRRLDLSYNDFSRSPIPSAMGRLRHLTHLCLMFSNFSGRIPGQVSMLSHLVSLDLAFNEFHGEFPIKIFNLPNLPNLQYLSLSYNLNLSGTLPEFHEIGHLRHLDLGFTKFSGELPNSIGNLCSLDYLDVHGCSFDGTIPSSMPNLTQLTYLDLSHNNFNAWTLPSWIGRLPQLSDLGLDDTNLRGEIPSFLANLTQLRRLYLESNQLRGHFPFWISNITHLEIFDIYENNLKGSVSDSIFDLPMLGILYLQKNNFSGTLELDKISKLKNLRILDLSGNRLSISFSPIINFTSSGMIYIGLGSCNLSSFPPFLQGQNDLEVLDLSQNKLHGIMPKWLWGVSVESLGVLNLSSNLLTSLGRPIIPWKNLETIELQNNRLYGSVPVPPPSTSRYLAGHNSLNGNLPLELCTLTSLSVFDVSNNNLSGTLPPCFTNFSKNLQWLNLNNNSFDGTVSEIFSSGSDLRMVDLSRNHFVGYLPRSLANCSMLGYLDVSNNNLSGNFPYWLGKLPELQILVLGSNMFFGGLAMLGSIKGFSKLRIIDISCNRFSGCLPGIYFENLDAMRVLSRNTTYMGVQLPDDNFVSGYEKRLSTEMVVKGVQTIYEEIQGAFIFLDFSSNRFDGQIPASISHLKGLHHLNLSNNLLRGKIPGSFGDLSQLEALDLSRNKLTGDIPLSLVKLTCLSAFNVSYNNLSGIVPHGSQFDTFQCNSYIGNLRLHGDPWLKCESAIQVENEDVEETIKVDWVVISMGYIGGLVNGIVIGCIFITRKHGWFVEALDWMSTRYKMKK